MSSDRPEDFTIQLWLAEINHTLEALETVLNRIAEKLEHPRRRTGAPYRPDYETLYRVPRSLIEAYPDELESVSIPRDFIPEDLRPDEAEIRYQEGKGPLPEIPKGEH